MKNINLKFSITKKAVPSLGNGSSIFKPKLST